MTPEEMKIWVNYVKEREENWPPILDDEEHMLHWLGRLFIGRALFKDYKQYEGAYVILKEIYLNNEIRHTSDLFGSYEDYIVEKVDFFKDMAELTYIITKEAAQSIPYIDEALIMLDGSESVSPYVDQNEFKKLRKYYVEKSLEEVNE